MDSKISAIYLETNELESYSVKDDSDYLESINKINIFIGANNSGKSRFIRTLFSEENVKFIFDKFNIIKIDESIIEFKNQLADFFLRNSIADYGDIRSNLSLLRPIKGFNKETKIEDTVRVFNAILNTPGGHPTSGRLNGSEISSTIGNIARQYPLLVNINPEDWAVEYDKIYFPTLRGLRRVSYNTDTESNEINGYSQTTIRDYFSNKGGLILNIYTGLELYSDTKNLLLGNREGRDKIKKFEEFLSETFFNNKEVNIIPRIDDEVVYVRIGSEERKISDLGDGIQSIIILTYPLFFNRGKELKVFIEEPEHYLHPGFQRIFIETLLKPQFASFQYFITSHSNHLLDITLDTEHVSVFTFRKNDTSDNPSFIIENVENDDTNTLELLGVRNSAVFLSNCTIWVEGITDRIYIRKYIEVYQKLLGDKGSPYKEDIHYSFVEYGGANITHWSFLSNQDENVPNINVDRLCSKLFLITDKDNAGELDKVKEKSKKHQRHLELKKKLEERYYCLESKEIENTLSPKILEMTVKSYDKSSELKNCTHEDYKNKSIGTYLDKSILNANRKFSNESGSINDKVQFAKRAVNHIKSFDDLTDDAKKLTESVYVFIKSNNT